MAKNPQRRYMNSAALVSALSQAMLHPDQADDEFSVPPQTPSSLSISNNVDALHVARTAVLATPTPLPAAAARVAPAAKSATSPKVIPLPTKAAPTYVAPPRANPTPITAPAKTGPKPDLIVRKKKRTTTRKLAWLSVPAAAACAAFAYYHYVGFKPATPRDNSIAAVTNVSKNTQAPVIGTPEQASASPKVLESEVALDVSAPTRVKVDEKAVLSAAIKGVDDPSKYEIVWHSGSDKPQSGSNIAAQFKADKEYDVVAIRTDTGKEVSSKHIRIETDLTVTAFDDSGPDPAAPSRLDGLVAGGPGADKTEVRWYDIKNPNEILSTKFVFEPQSSKPGSYVYVFQARRKGAHDWNGAATDKVPFMIQAKVPAEFTQAMKDAEKFMKEAETADTGSTAQLNLKDALECYEKAQRLQPENAEALHRKQEALRRARAEGEYAKLMSDSRERYYQAEVEGSDLYKKLQKLELALQPCRDAQTTLKASDMRVHPEVLAEMKRIEDMKQACTQTIEDEKTALKEYDSRMDKARAYVKEAEKYQNLSVALPHWEDAWNCFNSLKKQYPKLATNEGFQLEIKKAQENYYKAYLFVTVGFVPARPEDTLYQKQPKSTPAPRSPAQLPTSTQKERGTILDQ